MSLVRRLGSTCIGKRLAAAIACAVVLAPVAGCGSGGGDGGPDAGGATASGGALTPSGGSTSNPAEKPVDVYFTSGEQFQPVGRKLPGPAGSPVPAMKALLEGPTAKEVKSSDDAQTAIPAGTELKRLRVTPSGKAVVKLSPKFTAGIPARSAARTAAQRRELHARVGQVVYTLSQYHDVRSAKVVSGGITVAPDVTKGDFQKPPGGPPAIVKPRGEKQAGAKLIQQRLADLGYLPANAVDGLYGYQTQQAVTAFQAWEGLDRDGVVGPLTSAALAQAHRPKPGRTGPSRRIEVYRDKGVLLLVKDGATVRVIHVSPGGPATPTPPGTFTVFRKELQSWSVPFSTWLPFASYFNAGIAFHEYADVPPYPASHGCVRVPAPEAKRVYAFARVGTVVIVI